MQILLRKNQQIPRKKKWNIWLLLAGRGFGKTLSGSMAIAKYIIDQKANSVGIIGQTVNEIWNVMINGKSGLLKSLTFYKSNIKIKSNRHQCIKFSNGTSCFLVSAYKIQAFRGLQFDLVWVDELCKFINSDELFKQINLCLRIGMSKMIITTTPKNIPILNQIINKKGTIVTRGSSFHNKKNLSNQFLKIAQEIKNTPIGKQEIMGSIIDQNLWSSDDIQYQQPKKIIRYRIGIDPAVSGGLTGIILVGLDEDNICYVLDDFSTHSRAEYWVAQIKEIVDKYNPIEISVEINQGGNLITHLLEVHNIKCLIIQQRAIKSKAERNVATYMLYKVKKVLHSKVLYKLEQEMLIDQKDRVDALTWALYKFSNKKIIDLCFI